MHEADVAIPRLVESLERTLGRGVVRIDRQPGGRNSRVYRVEASDGARYAVKLYVRRPGRPDSLETEFGALTFIRDHGVLAVPRPIARDAGAGWAAYEYVDGESVRGEDVTEEDVAAAVEFLARLRALREAPGAAALPAAAEACVAVRALLDGMEHRLARLHAAAAAEPSALGPFLTESFTPALARVVDAAERRLGRSGRAVDAVLPRALWTLSPSDFGFHNALRRPGDGLVFVDFEYFGWDDPAKMIADVLLHPGMELSEPLRAAFAKRAAAVFDDDGMLGERLETLYPLFGFKWCLILLNEFLGADLRRRQFAAEAQPDAASLRAGQLAKARTMLERVLEEHERFPYRF